MSHAGKSQSEHMNADKFGTAVRSVSIVALNSLSPIQESPWISVYKRLLDLIRP